MVGDSLLDVGCANGATMELLEPYVRTIVGIEYAHQGLADFSNCSISRSSILRISYFLLNK
jgi:cyclopropane fatty-acyl-phospholipid synthase-like methyltransferase